MTPIGTGKLKTREYEARYREKKKMKEQHEIIGHPQCEQCEMYVLKKEIVVIRNERGFQERLICENCNEKNYDNHIERLMEEV